MTMPVNDSYSIVRIDHIKWRNDYLLAEIRGGSGTEYEVQSQMMQPEPFTIPPEITFALPGDTPEIDVIPSYTSTI
jgi:hypothetical protein